MRKTDDLRLIPTSQWTDEELSDYLKETTAHDSRAVEVAQELSTRLAVAVSELVGDDE